MYGFTRNEDVRLTHDEAVRIRKAFKDPEFLKLFKEYTDELSNPDNRKRYEEEIRLHEMERGIDVEFVNPTPVHCLKTRHWPKIYATGATTDKSSEDSVKVFINVCKSDKVGCPVIEPAINYSVEASGGCFWSLPHSFSPAREDFDKKKRRAMIYDVAFHSKAFDLTLTHPGIRRLLDYTAVDGVRRQFNLCFGKTAEQAAYLCKLFRPAHVHADSTNAIDSPLYVPQSLAHEEALLKTVRTLKGTVYMGVVLPTVIRRRRPDYDSRQAELAKQISEDIENCSDPSQREALKKLATHPYFSADGLPNKVSAYISAPIEPSYTVTHCSEFDMISSREALDVNPLRPPDSLKIAIKLPGLSSSSCLDLDVTSSHLMLTSEKPVAYKLNLKFPFEVNETKGAAKFDKSNSLLTVVIPVVKNENTGRVGALPTLKEQCSTVDSKLDTTLVCATEESSSFPSPFTPAGTGESTKNHGCVRRPGRRRNRRRHTSASRTSSAHETLDAPSVRSSSFVASELDSYEGEGYTAADSYKSPSASPPVMDSGRCEKLSSPSPGFSMDFSVTRISIQELQVSKDRRLAPVRFRQDPLSLSVLLPVRGILPATLSLHWASEPTSSSAQQCNHLKANLINECLSSSLDPLSLLLQFSSCGPGGFTMDWGLVLRYPLPDECTLSYRECNGPWSCVKEPAQPQDTFCHHISPRIMQSSFSHTGAVLVVAKSLVSDPAKPPISCFQKSIHGASIWWRSIAVGRTLSAGMQEYPFVGLEDCLTDCIGSSDIIHRDSQIQFGKHTSHCLQVISASPSKCDISWFRPNKASPHAASSTKNFLPGTTYPNVPTQAETFAYTELDSTLVLKGILKTRSYSGSSADEQTNGFVCFSDAGLADTHTDHVFSDDFPSADSGAESEQVRPSADDFYNSSILKSVTPYFSGYQRLRRFYSNEKLAISESTCSNDRECNGQSLNASRHRRHSVNFSAHDQRMAYSPRDTVEALHHALFYRHKKFRRRESRRRAAVTTGPHSTVCNKKEIRGSSHCLCNVTPVPNDNANSSLTSDGAGTRSSVDSCDHVDPDPNEQKILSGQLVCGLADPILPIEPMTVGVTLMNSANSKSTLLTQHNSTHVGFSDQCTLNLSTSCIFELDGE